MRILLPLAAILLFWIPAFAQKPPAIAPPCATGDATCSPAAPGKSELKQAQKEYRRAENLRHKGQLEEAVETLDRAIALSPNNPEYVSKREMLRQQLVTIYINRGNAMMNDGKSMQALGEFRQALLIDPKNEFALQRVQDALPLRATLATTSPNSRALEVVSQSKPVVLSPSPAHHDFHFRGFSRNLLEQITSAYGVKATFDESVTSRPVRFDIDNVDFYTAIQQAEKLAHVFWVPLTSNQLFFANDTQALRREFEHMVSRTFYLSNATAPQDVTDAVNLLRTIFDVRLVVAQAATNSVLVRAPVDTLDAAAKVLENYLSRRPQINLDVQVFQISHSLMQQVGITLPLSFQVLNVPASALALLGQSNIQDLINQLFSSGAINQANTQAIQALLSQLQNQQNSLLNTPFATFGKGKSLFAVPIPPLTAHLELNESDLQSLSKLTLRTSQGNAATMRIGTRYPILNTTFSPISSSAAINQVLQNQSYVAPFPSFSYEDLGITLKATPQVLGDDSVNLKLEISIRSLTAQQLNGIPVIANREFSATMSVKDAEPAVIAGFINQSDQRSLNGLPGASYVPGLSGLTTNKTNNIQDDELLIVVTPYVVSPARSKDSGPEVWLPAM